jgi:hypothetical protein
MAAALLRARRRGRRRLGSERRDPRATFLDRGGRKTKGRVDKEGEKRKEKRERKINEKVK